MQPRMLHIIDCCIVSRFNFSCQIFLKWLFCCSSVSELLCQQWSHWRNANVGLKLPTLHLWIRLGYTETNGPMFLQLKDKQTWRNMWVSAWMMHPSERPGSIFSFKTFCLTFPFYKPVSLSSIFFHSLGFKQCKLKIQRKGSTLALHKFIQSPSMGDC